MANNKHKLTRYLHRTIALAFQGLAHPYSRISNVVSTEILLHNVLKTFLLVLEARPSSRMSAQILSLPDELLLHIFDDDDITNELYILSLLSRRLHYICLPLFLAHHGISNPSDKAEITIGKRDQAIDAVSALRVALFTPSIKELRFSYSAHLNCDAGLTYFSKHISRFQRLLQRLDSVSIVHISIGALCDLCIKESPNFQAVATVMKSILDLAIEKSCSSLSVSGRCWRDIVNFESTLEHKSWLHRRITAAKEMIQAALQPKDFPLGMRGKGWRFVADSYGEHRRPFYDLTTSKLISKAHPSSNLETLVIRSAALLTPPLSSWTLQLLKTSKVRCLQLEGISYLELDAWSAILPCVANSAKHLTHLTVHQCDIHIVDLLQLLSHLPRLNSLYLDDSFANEPYATFRDRASRKPRARPNPDFPVLLDLRAPTELVHHFLNKPRALQKLQSLGLVVSRPHLCDLDSSLFRIYNHLSSSFRSSTWYPHISLDVQYAYQNDMRDDTDEFMLSTPSGVFRHISSISLHLRWTNHADNPFAAPPRVSVTQAICDWLGLFPEVTQVSLKLCVFHENVQTLMDGIRQRCPKIETKALMVNGTSE